ncbi:transposase [Candidatus Regiella endosymbiont of Tuberolachnus salignus]|uniref:transposase n=1 Tax=Candidatus Regiella endosymbiont of Tuberolachnus salignus TaxID=3077956 RepID=UPI0030CDEAEC
MKNRHYPIKASDFIKEIEPHILNYYKRPGRPASISHYQFFSAVLYVLRTGIPWRDVPAFYGHWHTIYTRFKRWSENGLFWHLLYLLQKRKKISLNCVWIDSTTVIIHRHGSGSLKKRTSVDRAWSQRDEHQNSCRSCRQLSQGCLFIRRTTY